MLTRSLICAVGSRTDVIKRKINKIYSQITFDRNEKFPKIIICERYFDFLTGKLRALRAIISFGMNLFWWIFTHAWCSV